MNSKLRKCFLGIALGYVIILCGLFYWHLFADLGQHPANPRYYLMFRQARGSILDRHGDFLASSAGEDYKRVYATASLAHVVGYFHQRYGLTGLERLYHEELFSGRSLYTTLDLEIQIMVEEVLGDRVGRAIVLKPSTGEVLALVSSPTVDGNALDEFWPDYLEDLRSPFLNRITQGLYPPGSLIKPIVYGGALAQKLVDPAQIWVDQGALQIQNRTLSNSGGKALGAITTDQALAFSSNVVFARLAMDLGDSLLEQFLAFGLGSQTNFELSSQRGYVPPKASSPYALAQLGIGQGELLVTPLHMAMVVAAIANRGVMMKPYLIQELRGGLQMRQINRPQVLAEVMPEQVALIVRDAMVLAVQEGTAHEAVVPDLDLAAKTGTAQVGQGKDHAWFMGFAPSHQPEVAVVVLVEHGGFGGTVATPLGAQMIAKAIEIVDSEKGKR